MNPHAGHSSSWRDAYDCDCGAYDAYIDATHGSGEATARKAVLRAKIEAKIGAMSLAALENIARDLGVGPC